MKRGSYKSKTLCIDCMTPSPTCSWKYNLTPVDGWDAEEYDLKVSKTHKDTYKSYTVKSCPLYEKNERVKEEPVEEVPRLGSIYRERYLERRRRAKQ